MRRVGVGAEKPSNKSMADTKLKEEIKVLKAENEQLKAENVRLAAENERLKVPEKK